MLSCTMQLSLGLLFPMVVVLFPEPSVWAGAPQGPRTEGHPQGQLGMVTGSANCPANGRQVPSVRQVWGRARRSAHWSRSISGSVDMQQGAGMAVTWLPWDCGSASGCKPQLKTSSRARRWIPRGGVLADLFRGSLR